MSQLVVGVLSLQGDFREHIATVERCGQKAFGLNRPEQLSEIDALILPGGESTTIAKLAKTFGLFDPIRKFISDGGAVFGSCAGMILLAHSIQGAVAGQESFGGIDMTVRRNAFGRQVDSFESDIEFEGIPLPLVKGIFIRAPWVEQVGGNVKVLANLSTSDGSHPVAVSHGRLLATAFHPEITADIRVHEYFLAEMVGKSTR